MRSRHKYLDLIILFFWGVSSIHAETITINIDGKATPQEYSPYVLGRNNSTSENPDNPTTEEEWRQINESGICILRENCGNNS
ncbi:MAG: hypothetical protein UHD64_01835, partial [Bacteroidales bacterium]|nr:hypothetical protein [Bacteroidales bacterium]